jgi:multidrug efflux pump subunit AcrA (membrane-fusion protein)
VVEGRVTRIDPQVLNDRVTVDVELLGELPPGARPDLSVEGLIEVARLDDVLHVRKPVYSQENGRLEVFRLHADDTIASRATVEFGRGTVHSIEVTAGLQEGDQIVVSDTTRWKSFELVKLK